MTDHNRREKRRFLYFLYLILILTIIFAVSRTASRLRPGHKMSIEYRTPASAQPAGMAQPVILATTTSLYDSGLLDRLLPVFEGETGFRVKVLAVGSGEALEMGRRQAAELLLVHSPEQELKFMEEGCGWRREEFMSSDFIIVGPQEDPAGIRGLDFVEAFSRIARRALFVSRADNSGTHNLELRIWSLAEINPSGSWYLQTGQGMGESLRLASEKQAYILADYPTFVRLRSGLALKILCRDDKFKNIYSVIIVENKSGRVNTTGAEAAFNFLLSEKAQRIISGFKADSKEEGSLFRALKLKGTTGDLWP